jgi:hypothetical protein
VKAEEGVSPKPNLPKGPNCWDCRYLTTTWDVNAPYGCKFMGFRSRVIPSLEVLRTDGRFCVAFVAKPPRVEKKTDKPVEQPSDRQKTDFRKPIVRINLIT